MVKVIHESTIAVVDPVSKKESPADMDDDDAKKRGKAVKAEMAAEGAGGDKEGAGAKGKGKDKKEKEKGSSRTLVVPTLRYNIQVCTAGRVLIGYVRL